MKSEIIESGFTAPGASPLMVFIISFVVDSWVPGLSNIFIDFCFILSGFKRIKGNKVFIFIAGFYIMAG